MKSSNVDIETFSTKTSHEALREALNQEVPIINQLTNEGISFYKGDDAMTIPFSTPFELDNRISAFHIKLESFFISKYDWKGFG